MNVEIAKTVGATEAQAEKAALPITLIEAITQALAWEIAHDDSVVVLVMACYAVASLWMCIVRRLIPLRLSARVSRFDK